VLLDKLPDAIAKSLMLFSHIITFVFLAAVSYYGYQYLELVIELEEMSIDLEIPMWIPYLVIPISFAFGAFRVFEKILDIFQTPADQVLQHSEAEMILEEMGRIGNLVKDVEKKTGGML
jgi:C4-dicarboxylate transporter DctQ subunit